MNEGSGVAEVVEVKSPLPFIVVMGFFIFSFDARYQNFMLFLKKGGEIR